MHVQDCKYELKDQVFYSFLVAKSRDVASYVSTNDNFINSKLKLAICMLLEY